MNNRRTFSASVAALWFFCVPATAIGGDGFEGLCNFVEGFPVEILTNDDGTPVEYNGEAPKPKSPTDTRLIPGRSGSPDGRLRFIRTTEQMTLFNVAQDSTSFPSTFMTHQNPRNVDMAVYLSNRTAISPEWYPNGPGVIRQYTIPPGTVFAISPYGDVPYELPNGHQGVVTGKGFQFEYWVNQAPGPDGKNIPDLTPNGGVRPRNPTPLKSWMAEHSIQYIGSDVFNDYLTPFSQRRTGAVAGAKAPDCGPCRLRLGMPSISKFTSVASGAVPAGMLVDLTVGNLLELAKTKHELEVHEKLKIQQDFLYGSDSEQERAKAELVLWGVEDFSLYETPGVVPNQQHVLGVFDEAVARAIRTAAQQGVYIPGFGFVGTLGPDADYTLNDW